MASFNRSPLRVVDRIYGFIGGLRGLVDFALGSSIQPVHDVSRESELGSGLGSELGYFTTQNRDSHVAAGEIRTTADPWAFAETMDRTERRELMVWLIYAGFLTDNNLARFFAQSLSIEYPLVVNILGSPNIQPQWLISNYKHVTGGSAAPEAGVLLGAIAENDTDTNFPKPIQVPLPFPVPDGSTIRRVSSQTGVGDIRIDSYELWWMGARGARPPGLA